MSEYIKRTDVMKICESYSEHCFNSNDARGQDIADRILDDVVEIPTADVEEVVRCKKCKYFTKEMIGDDLECICKSARGMINPAPDFYCSYGERRTDDEM